MFLLNEYKKIMRNKQQKKINKKDEEELKISKRKFRDEKNILLLGTEESGKSTFLKQMRIWNGNEYTVTERLQYVPYIYHNILIAMQAIVKAMDSLGMKYNNRNNSEFSLLFDTICVDSNTEVTGLDSNYVNAIKQLWFDSGIQECYRRRNEYKLSDSAKYYFENIDRICSENYIPTEGDIIRVRIPTTGIAEHEIEYGDHRFRIIDIGGQRAERRKWIHFFENVTSVIFMAALNEYDRTVYQSKDVMKESLALFQSIVTSHWLRNSPFIFILNKTDLLEEKILTSNLVDFIPQYDGPVKDSNFAKEFILKMYLDLNSYSDKVIYTYYACATDTNNIKDVFNTIFTNYYALYRCTGCYEGLL